MRSLIMRMRTQRDLRNKAGGDHPDNDHNQRYHANITVDQWHRGLYLVQATQRRIDDHHLAQEQCTDD